MYAAQIHFHTNRRTLSMTTVDVAQRTIAKKRHGEVSK